MNSVIIQAKAAAKRVRLRLAELGVALNHAQALETVASVQAGTDWNRYCAASEKLGNTSSAIEPTPLIFSLPGEGGWSSLRIHDLLKLEKHPVATSIWCFPAELSEELFINAQGIHVLRTWTEVAKIMASNKWHELSQHCQGKILLIHAPKGPEGQQECLENARKIYQSFKATPLLEQAMSISWLDSHRWTQADGAEEFLAALTLLNKPLRFHTQIQTDASLLAQHWPIRVLPASSETQNRMFSYLSGQRPAQNPINMAVEGLSYVFDVGRLDTLEGCVSYTRHLSGRVRGELTEKPLKFLAEINDTRREKVEAFLRDEINLLILTR